MNDVTNIKNRTLFFGDNLEIIEEKIPDESFDLIYLDPPFNSNRNYNVLFKEGKVDSSAQIHAFEDTWEWTDVTVGLFEDLKDNPNPQISILINSLYEFMKDTPMMAYLVNMTTRLIPLRRILKLTGSIYLHCDPTASHYLKIIMDVIFGKENFLNEIIWYKNSGGIGRTAFSKRHDVILFYGRTKDYFYDGKAIGELREQEEGTFGGYFGVDEDGRKYREVRKAGKVYKYYMDEPRNPEDVWEISQIPERDKTERLGYPTQKPEALLERIIKASSKEEDWILDPFCGCGTTVAVAERLRRNWVGIDISMQAIKVIVKRMQDHYPNIGINIDGIPTDYQSAVALSERDKFAFQDWAIALVDAYPPSGESKKGADQGIDGIILFREKAEFNNPNPKLCKILVQVKGGHHTRANIATLKGDMDRENAPMGIFITLQEPTREMKKETALAGTYKYSDTVSFPKVQILSINDWFNGKNVLLPTDKINPFKTASAKSDQTALF